ncbi:unnamed protein product [Lampetra planeri]
MSNELDREDEATPVLDDKAPVVLVHSAVLQTQTLVPLGQNLALDALVQIVQPDDAPSTKPPREKIRPVVAVSRRGTPLVEWDENDEKLMGAFPTLFMLGKGVPKGQMTVSFYRHLGRFYDGRFEDPLWISTAFNQKQRHACIRKAASIGTKHSKTLESLGDLAILKSFRETLARARDNPLTQEAKVLNAKICKVLSMVGSTVPFSPFERAATRPKLLSMRYRYGVGLHFITLAPPEFEDLTTLHVAILRDKHWNASVKKLQQEGTSRSDLPNDVTDGPGGRLRLTGQNPMLVALSFLRKQLVLLHDVIRCPATATTRVSRNYTQRERGAYGVVSAFNAIVEPQLSGRLHWHMTLYSSCLEPSLLTRLAAAPDNLKDAAAAYLASTSCTHVSLATHDWLREFEAHEVPKPRAAEIAVPPASDYEAFVEVAERKAILTGWHSHGFTCEKGKRGKYMCRLSMGREVHNRPSCPLLLTMHKNEDISKGIRCDIEGREIDAATIQFLEQPLNHLNGVLLRPHLRGPIVWELHRPEQDAMFVETNIIATNLLGCHNNSSIISGQDAGEAVEEYEASYMTKGTAELR